MVIDLAYRFFAVYIFSGEVRYIFLQWHTPFQTDLGSECVIVQYVLQSVNLAIFDSLVTLLGVGSCSSLQRVRELWRNRAGDHPVQNLFGAGQDLIPVSGLWRSNTAWPCWLNRADVNVIAHHAPACWKKGLKYVRTRWCFQENATLPAQFRIVFCPVNLLLHASRIMTRSSRVQLMPKTCFLFLVRRLICECRVHNWFEGCYCSRR